MSDRLHNNPGRELETGDVQTQGHQLDERASEEMIYKLVDCLYSSDGEVDIDAVDQYLEELDQAEEEPEEFDVEKSLQQFRQRFDTAFEYRMEEIKPARKRRPLARIAIIAAAMCTFIFTAQASGWDILGAIAQWTSEQFSFVTAGDQKDDAPETREFASLQEVLDYGGVSEKVCPTKFPDGTKISSVQIRRKNGGILFSASYDLRGEVFYISVRKSAGVPYSEVEINNPNVEVYLASGIEHHLVNDVKQSKVVWYNNGWECRISGNLNREELVLMIDSIYKGGST